MEWSKVLSRTDAQQETGGYPVPYLRFTRAHHVEDTQTWFRDTFFADQVWTNGFFGDNPVEQADVVFDVTILGDHKGARQMMVTHDEHRQLNNNTPNTYLHYDDHTRSDLQHVDCSGHTVTVSKDGEIYRFAIT